MTTSAHQSTTTQRMVSIVVPMWNELRSIGSCLNGFEAQTLTKDRFEVLVVDGGSDDGSLELVEELASTRPWIRVINNPARRIPIACNLGVEHARGDIVCFFSAHGDPSPTFVENVIRVLEETSADGVGGRYLHEGTDPSSTAIGLAMASRFGMASPHRFATSRHEVDTISHPAYRTELIRSIGGFNEAMQRNEDYELNWRIRDGGGRLIFDPSIESIYHPRGSLRALARQFFWYGVYKSRMLRKHPRSIQARHLVPPATAVLAALAPFSIRSKRWRIPTIGLCGTYIVGVALASADAQRESGEADGKVLFAAFPIMHFAWGTGFLAGFTKIEAL